MVTFIKNFTEIIGGMKIMKILKIISLVLLIIMDLEIASCYLKETKEKSDNGIRISLLIMLTFVMMPTLYIILN